jgi:subtilisin family serine protease
MHQDRYYLVNLNDDPDWATLLNNPQRFSGIEYIQPNFIRMQHAIPNDTYFPSQLFNLCNIPQAWDYSTSSPLIIVGVVDSGMLREHPDLAPNLYVNPAETINGLDSDGNGYIDDWSGWDFVDAPELADMALGDFLDPDNDVTDENFHGTHVAGIIGAAGKQRDWSIRSVLECETNAAQSRIQDQCGGRLSSGLMTLPRAII